MPSKRMSCDDGMHKHQTLWVKDQILYEKAMDIMRHDPKLRMSLWMFAGHTVLVVLSCHGEGRTGQAVCRSGTPCCVWLNLVSQMTQRAFRQYDSVWLSNGDWLFTAFWSLAVLPFQPNYRFGHPEN